VIETKMQSLAQTPEEPKKRKPVSEAVEAVAAAAVPANEAEALRAEVERLKKIIEYGKVKEEEASPYSQVQLGDAQEVRLVEERKQALGQEDVDRIREIDKELDGLRGKVVPQGNAARPHRTPIATRDPLKFGKREGYRRRVVNDVKDGARVQMFLDAGWRFVEGATTSADGEAGRASQMGSAVRRSVGEGTHAYLMEIPEELYMQDQKKKWDKLDALEKGMINESADRVEGRYGGITINR